MSKSFHTRVREMADEIGKENDDGPDDATIIKSAIAAIRKALEDDDKDGLPLFNSLVDIIETAKYDMSDNDDPEELPPTTETDRIPESVIAAERLKFRQRNRVPVHHHGPTTIAELNESAHHANLIGECSQSLPPRMMTDVELIAEIRETDKGHRRRLLEAEKRRREQRRADASRPYPDDFSRELTYLKHL